MIWELIVSRHFSTSESSFLCTQTVSNIAT